MDTIKESIGKHMTKIQGIQSTLILMSEWLLIGWSFLVIVDCVYVDVHFAIDINYVCLVTPMTMDNGRWTTYTSILHSITSLSKLPWIPIDPSPQSNRIMAKNTDACWNFRLKSRGCYQKLYAGMSIVQSLKKERC
jgi:hypothetical protein